MKEPMIDSLSEKYAEKCWDAANAITGFSAGQSIIFSIASQSADMGKLLKDHRNATSAVLMIIVFSVLYCVAVGIFARFQLRLLQSCLVGIDDGIQLRGIIKKTTLFRMAVIMWFGLLSILSIVHYFSQSS